MATAVSDYPKGAAPNGTPSASGSAYPKVAKLPEDIQPEVRALVARLQDYKAATEWGAIDDATTILDDDAVYDSPFMWVGAPALGCTIGCLGQASSGWCVALAFHGAIAILDGISVAYDDNTR